MSSSTGCSPSASIRTFLSSQRSLLSLEKSSELSASLLAQSTFSEKQLEASGTCVRHLCLSDSFTGLFGRVLVEFRRRDGLALPESELACGDIVSVGRDKDEKVSGVVHRLGIDVITVSFEELPDLGGETVTLFKVANEVTYQRYSKALEKLEKNDMCELVSVLFGSKEPEFYDTLPIVAINQKLNTSQLEAVKFALSAKHLALIHGPPGTGKTTTVVELICQSVKMGQRILACAASNIAIDNIAEKLSRFKVRICRIGHPSRLLPSIVNFSLDALVKGHENNFLVEDAKLEMNQTLKKLKMTWDKSEKSKWRNDLKHLRKEISERELKTVDSVLSNAQVILCTLTGAGSKEIQKLKDFDLVVIDEAAQALEVACWIPSLMGKKLVLAGDHNQLPPTIKSELAKKDLEVTMFERLLSLFGEKIKKMLVMQYRMHQIIMRWPSFQLYDDKLVAGDEVREHRLYDLDGVKGCADSLHPLIFVDTAGCNLFETTSDASSSLSKKNEGEADVVARHCKRLVASGVSPSDIAIISPYRAQVDCLRNLLSPHFPALEIGTVDGFQGREKEAIVISLVRSNEDHDIGFLKEDRRNNVAFTRARRHLCIIGNSETISCHSFLSSFVEYCDENADYRSAQEYLSDDSLLAGNIPLIEEMEEFKISSDFNPDSLKKISTETPKFKKGSLKILKQNLKKPVVQKSKHLIGDAKIVTVARDSFKDFVSSILKNLENQNLSDFDTSLFANCLPLSIGNCLQFPASLNSFQRMIVHEVAENLGLGHRSETVGSERLITVFKIEIVSQDKSAAISRTRNVDFTELFYPILENDVNSSESANEKKVETIIKQKKKIREVKPADDNFDSILEEFNQNRCGIKSCTKKVELVGMNCVFCSVRFCILHGLAEEHGCQNNAHNAARASVIYFISLIII